MPIGALIVAPHVAEPFFTGRPGAPVLRHGATYAGHPACCAAANVALDIYEREELIERGRTLESRSPRRSRRSPTTRWWARSAPGSASWRAST